MIAIGSDHGGYSLKEAIGLHLKSEGVEYKDFGTYSEESVDYPRFAVAVAKSVSSGESKTGILCCGTGIGVSIAANKIRGIRAALCFDENYAELARKHNNANILCLGGRVMDSQKAVKLVDIFLKTPFDGERHEKRISQITAIEVENK